MEAAADTNALVENATIELNEGNAMPEVAVVAENTTAAAEDDTAATNESTVNDAIRAMPNSSRKKKIRGRSRGFGRPRN